MNGHSNYVFRGTSKIRLDMPKRRRRTSMSEHTKNLLWVTSKRPTTRLKYIGGCHWYVLLYTYAYASKMDVFHTLSAV